MRSTASTLAVVLTACMAGCSGRGHGPRPETATALPSLSQVARATTGARCDGRVPARLPKHVFVIVLENEDFDATFGRNAPPALKALASQGLVLSHYYGIGHNSLDNYVAMISGQAPNPLTQADCPRFTDFVAVENNREILGQAKLKLREHFKIFGDRSDEERGEPGHPHGQAIGIGCVYPPDIETIADQLQALRPPLGWRAYMEDMPRCKHPAIGSRNDTCDTNVYAVRHNPFAYFHSLLDDRSFDRYDRPLGRYEFPLGDPRNGRGLLQDLARETPPALVFISPNLCHDGHNVCDGQGTAPKLDQVSTFLGKLVPKIQDSRAYEDDGMIVVTFDEAEVSYEVSDEALRKNRAASTSCCNEPPGVFGEPGIFGPGGGVVGALVLSPLVDRGENAADFNHYSLLRTVEELFGIHDHLGYAATEGVHTFQECGVFKTDASPAAQH